MLCVCSKVDINMDVKTMRFYPENLIRKAEKKCFFFRSMLPTNVYIYNANANNNNNNCGKLIFAIFIWTIIVRYLCWNNGSDFVFGRLQWWPFRFSHGAKYSQKSLLMGLSIFCSHFFFVFLLPFYLRINEGTFIVWEHFLFPFYISLFWVEWLDLI